MLMYSTENLSTLVKQYRKKHNLLQEDFATGSNISLRSVRNIEAGKTVNMDTVQKVLEYMDYKLYIAKNVNLIDI